MVKLFWFRGWDPVSMGEGVMALLLYQGLLCVFPHVCLLACRLLVGGVVINTPGSS